MMTDSQRLLAEYAKHGSEPAFRELVARYLDLVYSVAVRLVDGDTHLAEDVAQTVFADLARTARTLSQEVMLGGWLHRHTCFVAAKIMRGERRRRSRERQAVEMNALQDHSEADLTQVKSILDEAINQLHAEDRTAILLRFFEQRDFRSVGAALGSNEDAARMRVNRAVEKLHSLLRQRGTVLPVAALGAALAGQAVTTAPAGLAASISSAALASAAAGSGTALTLLKMMTMTKLKAGIVGAIAVASVTTPLVIQHQVKLREQENALQQQNDQLARWHAEAQRLSDLAARAKGTFTDDQFRELLRLRGEVGLLRKQTNELGKLREENHRLRASLANSGVNSPPTESDPAAEEQKQIAIAKMNDAKILVLGFHLYAEKNQDRFPTNFDQISPFMTETPALTGTNEFEIVYQGSFKELARPSSVIVLRERQARQDARGRWVKAYGFADGHSEYHAEPDGDFDAWEKQRMIAPPGPGQLGQ